MFDTIFETWGVRPAEPPVDVPALRALLQAACADSEASGRGSVVGAEIPTVADAAAAVIGHDWEWLVVEQVSAWADAHFAPDRVYWSTIARLQGPFAAWKAEAAADHGPELLGLAGFRRVVERMPERPEIAAGRALACLEIPEPAREPYLRRLARRARDAAPRQACDAQRGAGPAGMATELLVIQLAWEQALKECLAERGIGAPWRACLERLAAVGPAPVPPQPRGAGPALSEASPGLPGG
jgi:uncharacterized protein YbcC (UPF0753/DUF2309 family)